MTKKILNLLFVGVILLILLAGLARTLFFPKSINSYENRYAYQAPVLSVGSFLDGSYQTAMDQALSDQVQLAQVCKRAYNWGTSALLRAMVLPLQESHPGRYVNISTIRLFGGTHLVYYTRTLASQAQALDGRIADLNQVFAAHPQVDFRVYFIEKDTELDFETGAKSPVYEYLQDGLTLPAGHLARLEVSDFEGYSNWFYRTDHHWNHQGSYEGYLQLLTLLGVTEQPLVPTGTVEISRSFSGSKATASAVDCFCETFSGYRFDYPAMSIAINGSPAADYGDAVSFLNGWRADVSYSAFYGTDMGEIIFDTGTTDRGSLLVIGESYDNAVLKLLASHYDRTYSIDLRYYKAYMGQEFSLSDYLQQHGITQVLLVGNVDYFIMEEFMLGGE